MFRSILSFLILVVFLTVSAFAAAPDKSSKDLHGPQGAKPGSYEDWCEEHQVPESLDTRCDKSLIPAFKAAGDWCDKHGLPLSQCRKCNPKLKIVRPPKGSK